MEDVRSVAGLVLGVLGVAAVSCYAPQPQPGAPCSSTGACPEGLVCSPASMTCELRALDGGPPPDVASPPDAVVVDGLPPDGPPKLPVLVQQGAAFTTTADSLSLTLPEAPVAGHVLVMIGGDPQAGLAGVTGGGATWTRAIKSTVNANIEIWVGVTDGSSAIVTISLPATSEQLTMAVSEWANLASANLVDLVHGGNGPTSPASAGAITTTFAPELLLFAVGTYAPATWGVPSGGPWTSLAGVSAGVVQAEWYRVVTAPGTFAPTVTGPNNPWDAAIVGLRVAP